jgi:hypothetical protein
MLYDTGTGTLFVNFMTFFWSLFDCPSSILVYILASNISDEFLKASRPQAVV